jgi:hypothetical protein
MNRLTFHLTAVLMLSVALAADHGAAFAQSSGGSSGGASAGGSGGGSASSAGRAGGTASAPSSGVGGTATGGGQGATTANPMLRTGPGTSTSSGTPRTSDPRSLGNQQETSAAPNGTAPGTYSAGGTPAPAGTTTPSGTAYPSGTPLEAARQRSMESPAGTAVPPAASGVGGDGSNVQATPGLPNSADPSRGDASTSGDPSRLSGGGSRNRAGARGADMAECEAAWDEKTHMSKDKWRETCSRTLTDPHL